MSERFIVIHNWERFQNKDVWRKSNGRPPWIKAYTALLHDDDWDGLSQAQQGILVNLWLMYASAGRSVGETGAKRRLCRSDAEARWWLSNLEALSNAGFIEFVSREIRAPIAPRVEERREEQNPPTHRELQDVGGRVAEENGREVSELERIQALEELRAMREAMTT